MRRREILTAILGATAATLPGFLSQPRRPGASSGQDPLPELDVRAFGATGDGVTNDRDAIQRAIRAAAESGAGIVRFPPGRYRLGADTLDLYAGVTLRGAGVHGENDPSLGTVLLYEGGGAAIRGRNIKYSAVEDMLLDLRGARDGMIGIHLNGAWLSTLRNVRIINRGEHGRESGVLVDTNDGIWGAQHLYFERLEVPNSTVRLHGSGPDDQVMVSVFNVVRGLRYDLAFASSITLIDTTAEAFADTGFHFRDSDQVVMLGVDIEGAGDVGIRFGPRVRSATCLGLNFVGFTGRSRLEGAPSGGVFLAGDHPAIFWGPVSSLSLTEWTRYGESPGRHLVIGAANPDAVNRGAVHAIRLETEGDAQGQSLVVRGLVHGGNPVELLRVGPGSSLPGRWPYGRERPPAPEPGAVFFDARLGRPIWFDGRQWVDAAGQSV